MSGRRRKLSLDPIISIGGGKNKKNWLAPPKASIEISQLKKKERRRKTVLTPSSVSISQSIWGHSLFLQHITTAAEAFKSDANKFFSSSSHGSGSDCSGFFRGYRRPPPGVTFSTSVVARATCCAWRGTCFRAASASTRRSACSPRWRGMKGCPSWRPRAPTACPLAPRASTSAAR